MAQEAFQAARIVRFPSRRRSGPADAAVVYLTEGADKYALDDDGHEPIDCAARLALCHAACCRLRVPLTRQDLDEGVVEWDRDQPYLNRQRADGWCVHCDPASRRCTTYEHRPGLCRRFDCRGDGRIWIDFERRIPAPSVADLGSEPLVPDDPVRIGEVAVQGGREVGDQRVDAVVHGLDGLVATRHDLERRIELGEVTRLDEDPELGALAEPELAPQEAPGLDLAVGLQPAEVGVERVRQLHVPHAGAEIDRELIHVHG
jgi:hypothetical protein